MVTGGAGLNRGDESANQIWRGFMSRVSYGIMNPGAAEMTKAVIAGLQTLIDGAQAA